MRSFPSEIHCSFSYFPFVSSGVCCYFGVSIKRLDFGYVDFDSGFHCYLRVSTVSLWATRYVMVSGSIHGGIPRDHSCFQGIIPDVATSF
jgi:hypothetical protein